MDSPCRNLRSFVSQLEDNGCLTRVPRPINKDRHLMPLVIWQYHGLPESERKAFLFENVTDARGRTYDGSVVAGVLGASRKTYALAMNCAPDQIAEKWLTALSSPIAPKIVTKAAVKEVVMHHSTLSKRGGGVESIPVPISNPGFDGGPFLTAPFCVTKDPETGKVNVGTYRMMLKGPDKLGISCPPAQHIGIHLRKAKDLGTSLEVAVVLGAPPAVGLTSVAKIPYTLAEYGVAGAIIGEPIKLVSCETVDLKVPADAEIVIEGELASDYREPEGPFGEYTGYMGGKMMNGVLHVKCITHRRQPILQMFNEGIPSESSLIRKLSYEIIVWKVLHHDCNIPAVERVCFFEWSGSWKYCVIQMKKTNPAQPWQALMAASGFDPNLGKIVVAVDDDIDPEDPDAVNWALSFRMQPHRDVRTITHKYAALDPSAAPPGSSAEEARFPHPTGCSSLLIDATRKWGYPPVSLPRKVYMEEAKEIWQDLGLPALTPRMPWYGYSLGHWSKENEQEADEAVRGDYMKVVRRLAKKKTQV